MLSEGAGTLILESETHAKARGARVYCEVAGYGASDDAFHITAPDPKGSGAALAMAWALRDAGEEPEAVTYVRAHGTSTRNNDAVETLAIKQVFGASARRLMVSSTKSMTGHLLGAAGAIETAACALALRDGVVPPTINHHTPDPACDLDVVPNHAPQPRTAPGGPQQQLRVRREQRLAGVPQGLLRLTRRRAVAPARRILIATLSEEELQLALGRLRASRCRARRSR